MNTQLSKKQLANKKYYDNNRSKILENKKKVWYCDECKTEYRLSSKANHIKTLAHRSKSGCLL
jgi:hypothetical protein